MLATHTPTLTPAPSHHLPPVSRQVMLAKRDADEATRLKAGLSRAAAKANQDPWDLDQC